AHGYPGKVRLGDAIEGLDADFGADVKVFHSGTKNENGKIVTAGGRVLTVCALGEDFAEAQTRAYAAVRKIKADGLFCRRDIGWRAISR
ncbi:MAG: phosphoribosylglycinamide synthetase C domain-containing protein, partial [Rudaea sp.]